jgi:hypothetical protein
MSKYLQSASMRGGRITQRLLAKMWQISIPFLWSAAFLFTFIKCQISCGKFLKRSAVLLLFLLFQTIDHVVSWCDSSLKLLITVKNINSVMVNALFILMISQSNKLLFTTSNACCAFPPTPTLLQTPYSSRSLAPSVDQQYTHTPPTPPPPTSALTDQKANGNPKKFQIIPVYPMV